MYSYAEAASRFDLKVLRAAVKELIVPVITVTETTSAEMQKPPQELKY